MSVIAKPKSAKPASPASPASLVAARRATPRRLVHVLAAALVLALPLAARADNESRIFVDHVAYDAPSQTLTLHADILDAKGAPVENVTADMLELTANGQPLKVQDLEVQTSEKSQEPVAVVLLINASRGYQVQGEAEVHSTFQQAKEGAAQFIQRLSGNDKVAVVQYREGFPHEIIYSFASDFRQAREAVMNAQVPQSDLLPENNLGQQEAQKTLAPESVRAIDKAMNYLVENLDKLGSARRRFLIVMSDGKDRETRKAKITSKIQSMLEKYEEYRVRIHTIGFSPDDEQYLPMLQQVANGTGGVYVYVSNKDGLGTVPAVWDGIASRVKKQYILKAKLAELPDWGEPVKGKDEANYVVGLKVKMKDGAVAEAAFNDVRLPLPSINWGKILKIVGMVVGGLVGLALLIGLIVFLARRKGSSESSEGSGKAQRQDYDGPARGKLTVLQGPLAGEIFPLIDDVTTIGSMKGNTIVISDGSVSRRHAAIKIDQMRYEVADMNSTNGVLVNGQKVHKIFLKDGDRIQIGSTEIVFSLK